MCLLTWGYGVQFYSAESGGDFRFEGFGVSVCGSYDGCLKHGVKCDSRLLSVSFYEGVEGQLRGRSRLRVDWIHGQDVPGNC